MGFTEEVTVLEVIGLILLCAAIGAAIKRLAEVNNHD